MSYQDRDTLKKARYIARAGFAIAATALVFPTLASAHVKWFCGPIDLDTPPAPISAVLSSTFLSRFAIFFALVTVGIIVDAIAEGRWSSVGRNTTKREMVEGWIVRAGVGIYAVCLWRNMAMVPWARTSTGAILAPELLDSSPWVSLLQLSLAGLVVFRRTCLIAAIVLMALYGVGVARYGLFHMADYAYFIGVSIYLALISPSLDRAPKLQRWRAPILISFLSFSLMWTAVEKFLYPQWSELVLAIHPRLTLGFPLPFVAVTAGFVEFSLAFYLLIGRNLARLDAIVLRYYSQRRCPNSESWIRWAICR